MEIHRTVQVTLTPEDMGEEWPDHKRQYTSMIFRPDVLRVRFSRNEGEEIYESAPCINGRRVVKAGLSEHRVGDDLWSHRTWPEWATRAVEKAREIAEKALA